MRGCYQYQFRLTKLKLKAPRVAVTMLSRCHSFYIQIVALHHSICNILGVLLFCCPLSHVITLLNIYIFWLTNVHLPMCLQLQNLQWCLSPRTFLKNTGVKVFPRSFFYMFTFETMKIVWIILTTIKQKYHGVHTY